MGEFQSTRLREARHISNIYHTSPFKFQSTRLREARLVETEQSAAQIPVSIHAPA